MFIPVISLTAKNTEPLLPLLWRLGSAVQEGIFNISGRPLKSSPEESSLCIVAMKSVFALLLRNESNLHHVTVPVSLSVV